MSQLEGTRFIVTGGSKGIGKATARTLVEAGARVVVTARSRDRLEAAARETGSHWVPADVGLEEDVVRSVKEAVKLLGGLDGVVNNAGTGAFSRLEDLDARAFRRVWEVNVLGPALMAREALPHFAEAGGGDIVNISSTAGLKGDPTGTVYSASKFALKGMTQCWQAELRPRDVRVILVNPSHVETRFGSADEPPAPRPHLLHAEDIAHTVLAALTMERRGFIPEVTVFATNPWKD